MTLDSTFVAVLDYLGVFVFALSGAWLAIRRDLDLVGVVDDLHVLGQCYAGRHQRQYWRSSN